MLQQKRLFTVGLSIVGIGIIGLAIIYNYNNKIKCKKTVINLHTLVPEDMGNYLLP